MSGATTALPSPMQRVGDALGLAKPGVTAWNVLMAAGGVGLSGVEVSATGWAGVLAGTTLVVAAANGSNMVLERKSDALMRRTASRPTATGRLRPTLATVITATQATAGLGLLAWLANPLTAALGLLALVLYVGIYTPMKRRTAWATLPGAVAGALPPLMGWTAATGSVQLPGLALFALLMAWQLPHVLAIALLRQDEYARAGLHVPSMPLGPERTRFWIFITASATVSASLFLGVLGLVGSLYLGFAAAGAGALMVVALMGLEPEVAPGWPRWMLRLTVMYLPLITAGIFLDRWVG